MKYVNIPGTALTPSQLCLGTGRFGKAITRRTAFSLLDTFLDLGGTFIDTAHIYADWIPGPPKSASEKTIGDWLKKTGNRSRIFLATKGGHPDLSTPHISRLSKAEITQDLNESLGHLQTDFIDLYWLHRDDPTVAVAAILETLNELVDTGKIRYFGCSNWRVERIAEANAYAQAHNLQGFVANQPWWSLALPNPSALSDERLVVFNQADFDFHKKSGLAVIPYSAQGKGFFTKLDKSGAVGLSDAERAGFFNETNAQRWPKVKHLAEQYSASITAVVLSYLISQPFPTIPIIGCRTIDQLADSVAAVNLILTPEEVAYLAGES